MTFPENFDTSMASRYAKLCKIKEYCSASIYYFEFEMRVLLGYALLVAIGLHFCLKLTLVQSI